MELILILIQICLIIKRWSKKVIPKYREICKDYGLAILLIHHLNNNTTTLGSTATDGSIYGIITLKLDNKSNEFNINCIDYDNYDTDKDDFEIGFYAIIYKNKERCYLFAT